MASFQRKKNNPQSCSSASGGSPSVVKNKRKKKFDYNNGKCLHDLDTVTLESGIEMNPGRLFLRCPLWERVDLKCDYFVWADEINSDGEKNWRIQESGEESSWKNGQQKQEEIEEDLRKLQKSIEDIKGELKFIRKLLICIGMAIWLCAFNLLFTLTSECHVLYLALYE
ncbi:hypothetical protein PIB30_078329 [Stylosanthes scabra]|uniref:GRF-type domain-containing protein n=1 Tax=Stylosanthes scabra TaxID=79078 RepID=A0ABU6SRN3_9FABA|nr:hypothetical protein [Stylosanthes scabra]